VVVSFAPLYSFAANVAGEDAVVKTMMSTSGPHDFNPTDMDARLIRPANLFFINGLSLDNSVAETLRRGSGARALTVVPLGARIPEAMLLGGEEHADHDHGHGHHHDHGDHDPHVWLSPERAIFMVEAICDELKAADPAHAAGYDTRAAEYTAKLRQLQADGKELLKGKKDRKLVTFHESLAYFAKSFDLSIEGVIQKKPGIEPNSTEMSQLIKVCQEKKVRLIAVEPQYATNTSADAILRELRRAKVTTDPAVVQIDPLETADPGAITADWYERKMRANLAALAEAMK
jgi:ABC-type Zn uptake system ZnuABC Zn-binding protein ZnuA